MPTRQTFLSVALDAVCLAVIVTLACWIWPTWETPLQSGVPQAPAWGTIRDALLDGPDAGEWARSIMAFQDGRLADMDPHRLPTWIFLVNGIMLVEEGVAEAGHLANHLLLAVLGIGVWLIGRFSTGRSVGLAAASLAMLGSHATESSLRFGVDMTVLALIPLSICSAQLACRHWKLGLLSGGVSGVVMATHLSALPYALPAGVLILLAAKPGYRARAAMVHALGVGVVLGTWSWLLPMATFEDLQVSIANGILPGYRGSGQVANWAETLSHVREGSLTAFNESISRLLIQVHPTWLPWKVSILMFWLGVIGPGLKQRDGDSLDETVLGVPLDWKLGVVLLLCLAPLPLLAAAQTPDRYANNLAPAGALLLARGAFSLLALVLHGLKRMHPIADRLRPGLFTALGLGIFVREVQTSTELTMAIQPTTVELGRWQLGQVLKEVFPAGTGVAVVVREPLVAGQHVRCPNHICPEEATEVAFEECLSYMKSECPGEETLAYVTLLASLQDPNSPARPAMDKWVSEKWDPIKTIRTPGFSASIYAIPREEIADYEEPPQEELLSPDDKPKEDRRPTEDRRPMADLLGDGPQGKEQPAPLGSDGVPLPGTQAAPMGPDGRPLPAAEFHGPEH